MKIYLEHLGKLHHAEIEVGDLTVVCGENNTGKTYATYALYGFLRLWEQRGMPTHPLAVKLANSLPQTGVSKVDLINDLLPTSEDYFDSLSEEYTRQLPMVFASKEDYFEKCKFRFRPDTIKPNLENEFNHSVKIGSQTALTFSKSEGSQVLEITRASDLKKPVPSYATASFIDDVFRRLLWSKLVPRVHISSAERTGAAIFNKSLNFTRDKLFSTLHRFESEKARPIPEDVIPRLFFEYQPDYALPVRDNVQFMDTLETISKQTSGLKKACPQIDADFSRLIGGKYKAGKDGLFFLPKGGNAKLTMSESSSAVRSLLDVGFLLKHVLSPGDLFIIDEPELNLHPANQRKLARILALMVNHGVRVFLTTHSDYIIREFNTLIVGGRYAQKLNAQLPKKMQYGDNEFLSERNVKLYDACSIKAKKEGRGKKPILNVIQEKQVDSKSGMMIETFDEEIEAMNQIHDFLIELNYQEEK